MIFLASSREIPIFAMPQMTVADIITAFRLHFLKLGILDGIPSTIFEPYPALNALYSSVVAEPKIAAFIAKHAK